MCILTAHLMVVCSSICFRLMSNDTECCVDRDSFVSFTYVLINVKFYVLLYILILFLCLRAFCIDNFMYVEYFAAYLMNVILNLWILFRYFVSFTN